MSRLTKRNLAILKRQYEIGQEDPRPFNYDALDVKEALTELKSDGYHTFDELYEYRLLYNALVFNEWAKKGLYDVHLSFKHHDGEPCFGKDNFFVVVAETPVGQISNHYAGRHKDLFNVSERELANEWDGSDSRMIAKRLKLMILGIKNDIF